MRPCRAQYSRAWPDTRELGASSSSAPRCSCGSLPMPRVLLPKAWPPGFPPAIKVLKLDSFTQLARHRAAMSHGLINTYWLSRVVQCYPVQKASLSKFQCLYGTEVRFEGIGAKSEAVQVATGPFSVKIPVTATLKPAMIVAFAARTTDPSG